MKIEINGMGKVIFSDPQQKWNGGDVMQTARFAGQEMVAVSDDAGGFELHYLGYRTGGFGTIEEAKAVASAFAKATLQKLADMIR